MDDLPSAARSYVTAADVPLLNRTAIEDACRLARQVADALVIVAAFGVAAWAWITWKNIDVLLNADDDGFSSGAIAFTDGGDATVGDYASALAQTATYLLVAAAVAGIGLALRLMAAHVGNAVGADVSDVAVGDPLPDAGAADADPDDDHVTGP